MNRLDGSKSPPDVVEVLSEDERSADFGGHSGIRRQSAIEIPSDISDNEERDIDLQIVSEIINENTQNRRERANPDDEQSLGDEIEITGHNQIPFPDLEALIFEAWGGAANQSNSSSNATSRHTNTPIVVEPFHGRRRDRLSASILRNLRHSRNSVNQNSSDRMHWFRPFAFHPFSLEFNFSSAEHSVSANVLEAIRRSEEREINQKLQKEDKINHKTLAKKKQIAETSMEGYISTISAEINYVCELCAVVLGEGIPADFTPDPKYDENIEEHASALRTNAPWFCLRQCFDSDYELLRRVFAAKCGHVFCGRCIKNIGNRPSLRSKRNAGVANITDPRISAPRKCPVKDCGAGFMGKRTFTELFL